MNKEAQVAYSREYHKSLITKNPDYSKDRYQRELAKNPNYYKDYYKAHRARKLEENPNYWKEISEEINKGWEDVFNRNKKWTATEKLFLLKNMKMPEKKLSKILKRSVGAISQGKWNLRKEEKTKDKVKT